MNSVSSVSWIGAICQLKESNKKSISEIVLESLRQVSLVESEGPSVIYFAIYLKIY